MYSCYKERSHKLNERMDRIKNYLKLLPRLPKVTNTPQKDVSNDLDSDSKEEIRGKCEKSGSEDSVRSTSTSPSTSTQVSRSVPKDEHWEWLQRSAQQSEPSTPDRSVSKVSMATGGSRPELTSKKKRRKTGTLKMSDPLQPTSKNSFGLDIGQGINTIKFIKQHIPPATPERCQRLVKMIMKDVERLGMERSADRVRKGTLSTALSTSSTGDKSFRDLETAKCKSTKHGRKLKNYGSATLTLPSVSELEMYRVRYHPVAEELPHHYGLDCLQELFVPYQDHES